MPERRARAGVPDDVKFQTKPQIALAQIRSARDAHVPQGCILADAGYGIDTEFRDGITELQMTYVWSASNPPPASGRPGEESLPIKPPGGRGRPSTRVRRTAHAQAGLGQGAGARTAGACLADR